MSLLLQEKEITPNFYFMFLLSLSVKYLNFVALHGDRESVYYFSECSKRSIYRSLSVTGLWCMLDSPDKGYYETCGNFIEESGNTLLKLRSEPI